MMENYSNSYIKTTELLAKTPLALVKAIRDSFYHGSTIEINPPDNTDTINRWEIQGWNSLNGILLLKCLKRNSSLNLSAPEYYAQVVIKINETNNILIGLDPLGQINKDLNSTTWGVDDNKSNLFSGFKNITGSNSNLDQTKISGRVLVAEYEDAFTILIMNSASSAFYYIAHVGKVYLPTNKSDLEIGVDGFGLLVGSPITNLTATNGYWLAPPTTNTTNGSVIKISNESNNCWSLIRTSTPNANSTKDVLGKSRLIPYYISGLNPVAGEVGSSKYFRVFKTKLVNFTYVNSANNDSKQAWISCSNPLASPVATQDLLILWSKYENIYSL